MLDLACGVVRPLFAYLGDRVAGTSTGWFRAMYSRSLLGYRYGALE
jgi:hypothetical protein